MENTNNSYFRGETNHVCSILLTGKFLLRAHICLISRPHGLCHLKSVTCAKHSGHVARKFTVSSHAYVCGKLEPLRRHYLVFWTKLHILQENVDCENSSLCQRVPDWIPTESGKLNIGGDRVGSLACVGVGGTERSYSLYDHTVHHKRSQSLQDYITLSLCTAEKWWAVPSKVAVQTQPSRVICAS